MTPGRLLARFVGAMCSADLCSRVLEPAIADLQHDYMRATGFPRRLRALFRGYASFWQSFSWCFAQDAFTRDANEFNARAAVAFLIAVAAATATEVLLMHGSQISRGLVLRHPTYVGFSALTDTATLRFGIPLAMFPALFYASRRVAHLTPAALLRTIALGTLLTVVASGWVAPSIERWRSLRQREAFTLATGGPYYQPPIEWLLDDHPESKTWPDLIRGALAAPRHRFPGYPAYNAQVDRDLDRWHRFVIYDHVLLIVLAIFCGLLGWGMARRRDGPHGERVPAP